MNKVGYAVVIASEFVRLGALLSHLFAQAAELHALIEACKYAADQSLSILITYAFGVVDDFGTVWKHRNFPLPVCL